MTRRSRNQDEAASEGTDATLGQSSLSDEQATQLAETYNQRSDVTGAQSESIAGAHPEGDHGEYMRGYRAAEADFRIDGKRMRESVLAGCIHGIRIHVKDGESPGAVALRVVEIAEKIMLRVEEREKEREQANVAKPE